MRRPAALVSALAVALALAGCVAVPNAGSVQVGAPIEQDPDTGVAFSPSGPAKGATPDDIVQGFLLAQTSATDDFAIAREFLATSVEDTWAPLAAVSISSNTPAVSQPAGVETQATLTFTQSAHVDATGQYGQEPAGSVASTRDFQLVQQDGEWRISNLAPGIVLNADVFTSVFHAYSLYFFDPTYQYLVPDVRWFPVTGLTSTNIVDGLLAGPSEVLAGAVASAFPATLTLASAVSVVAGVATVDFEDNGGSADPSIDDTSPETRGRMRQQITASLATANSTIVSTVLTVGGVELVVPIGPASAIVDPDVNALPLVLSATGLGFANAAKVTPIHGVSEALASLTNVSGGTYANASATLAVRADGGVYRVHAGAVAPVDPRADLVVPSIDPQGVIWSANASGEIRVIDATGAVLTVPSTLVPAGDRLVSMDVSRDGTRLLLYVAGSATDVIPTSNLLIVAGIVRASGSAPTLENTIQLPVAAGSPIDAAWLDDQTVVTLSGGDAAVVTTYVVGGQSARPGSVAGAVAVAGGNAGLTGVRILTADGTVVAERSVSFQDTGARAAVLFSQQP